MGQEPKHDLAGFLFRVSNGCNQGVDWAMFSFRDLNGGTSTSKFTQAIGRINSLWLYDWGPSFLLVVVGWVTSVMSDSLRPQGLWPAKILYPWDSPGKNIGVGLSGECEISSVLSHLNKNVKRQTLKPSACHSSQTGRVIPLGSRTDRVIPLCSQTDHVIALRQISVTAQCYLQNKRKIHPWGMRACYPKRREEERERETEYAGKRDSQPSGSSFCVFFSLPLGLPYVNWTSQECFLFYLRSSLLSSDLPLFYFHRLFPPCLLATAILNSSSLY